MPSGYVYSWTGKSSSSFSLAANWYNDTLGATATAVPGTSDEALVVASGTLQGPGAVYELALTGSGAGLTVAGSLNGSYVYVGGTLTLASGATLGSGNLVDIGDGSSETIAQVEPTTLTVTAGAILFAASTVTGALDILVGQQGGNGTLVVTGANAQANAGSSGFWVGDNGTGVISVTAGGQLYGGGLTGSTPGYLGIALGSGTGSGALTVTGAGSEAGFGDIVDVGYGGTGMLTVSSGATLIAGDEQSSLFIGDQTASASGSVSISGASATLYGVVEDGAFGHGSLSFSNGATLFATTNASSGTAADWSVLIGAAAGSSGTLSIASQAELTASHGIAVGSNGTGSLSLAGGTLTILQPAGSGLTALAIGLGAGTTGIVSVVGGLIDDTKNAGILVGAYGSGTLAISSAGAQGGVVVTGDPSGVGLTIGAASGSSGVVTVSGANSALYVDGSVLDGSGGPGSIAVSAGATFTAGAAAGTLTGLAVGGSGGAGTISLATGALANVVGQTGLGVSGSGVMTVSGGSVYDSAAVGESAFIVGVNAGITANLLLTDAGSQVNVTGGLVIGDAGNGTITVQGGARLAVATTSGEVSPGIVIAADSGSTGTLMLASGATLGASTGMAVGSLGKGVLSVSAATLTINTPAAQGLSALSAGLAAGSSGTVDINGGLVQDTALAGVLLGGSGSAALSITQQGSTGGTLVTGDPGAASGLALAVGSGSSATLSVSGAASLLKVDGTVSDASAGKAAITIASNATFDAGYAATATGLALGGVGGSGSLVLGAGGKAAVLGQTSVGAYGTGSLTISGGSHFTGQASGFEAMVFASGAASSGTGLFTGAATSIQLTGGLEVGDFGTAQVSIAGGAHLVATTTSPEGVPSVVIAAGSGTGKLTVTGAGTRLTATGQFEVGGTLTAGAGNLLISSGATVSVAEAKNQTIAAATIGGAPGALAAIASVTGSGSAWSIGGQLAIGGSGGAAELLISAGGHVTAGSVLVDTLGHGSLGTISVTGSGSTLSAGSVILGSSASGGTLTVGTGATVAASGGIILYGQADLTGGLLSAGGTITVGAHASVSGYGSLSGAAIVDLGQIGVTSGRLTCLGPISGSGSLSIAGAGTLQLDKAEGKGVGIDFGAGGGTLAASNSALVLGSITGWSAGDAIAFSAQDILSDSYANGTLTLLGSNNATLGALHFSGSLSAGNFTLSHPTASETLISFHS